MNNNDDVTVNHNKRKVDMTHQTRHDKARELLRQHGARCINNCKGPNTAPIESHLEFWQTSKGLLILQFWNDGGVTTFADWPLGETWEDLEKAIS